MKASTSRILSIVCLLLLVASCLVSASPSFVDPRPSDVDTEVGSIVEIVCTVANVSDYSVYWQIHFDAPDKHSAFLGPGYNRNPSVYPRYLFGGSQADEGEYSLTITDTKEEDAGVYTCVVSSPDNNPTKQIREQAILTFGLANIIIPDSDHITCETQNLRFDNSYANEEGTVVSLTCSARGGEPPVMLEWKRNDQIMPEQNHTSGFDAMGRVMSYSIVTWELGYQDKDATYTCVGTHPAWQADKTCSKEQLWLLYKPVVNISPPWSRFDEGSSGTFTCTADADPEMDDFIWYIDGRVLTETHERFNFTETSNSSVLNVYGIIEADYDTEVVCVVTNRLGSGNKTAKILAPDVTVYTPLKLSLQNMVIIIGCIMLVIFIVTMVIVFITCCCAPRRKKKKRDDPNRQDGYNLTETDGRARNRPTREEMSEDAYAANVNKQNDGIDYTQFQGGAEINSKRGGSVQSNESRNSTKMTSFNVEEKESPKKSKKGSSKKKRGSSKKKKNNEDRKDEDGDDDIPDVTYATPHKKGSIRSRASNEDNTIAEDVESNTSNVNNQSPKTGHVLY